MPNNWKTYKLEEVLDALIDYRGKTPKKKNFGIPLITAKIVKQGKILEPTEFISVEDYNGWMTRGMPKIGDVVLTTEAPLGEVAQLKDSNIALAQRIVTLRGKKDFLDNGYLKYFLQSKEGQKRLVARESGTTVSGIKQSELRKVLIDFPSYIEQKSIAAILSAIDDKIENNLAINKTLEEMAMALYKHWFVDFGPFQDGEFVESELGMIPKGWKIVEFRELLSLLKDGSHNPPKRVDSGVKFIAGATDIKKLEVTFNKCSYITQDDYNKMHKTWEIKEKDILMTIVGTIGNTAIVQNKDLPFSLQRSIAIFRPIEEIPNYFIYLLINNGSFKEYVKAHTNPTGQPGIYLKILGSYVLAKPNFQILKQFNDVIEPLFDQMFSNLTENQTLTQLRDTLLPKLISGAVRLKEFRN